MPHIWCDLRHQSASLHYGRRHGVRGPRKGGRPMSLQYAVLALVLERRGYGYDLAQRLEERVGPAWRLNPSAVYPALDQLERAGYVTGVARTRGTRRSPRVVYSATPAGAAALDAWLSEPAATPEPIRSELQLRLAFAREDDRATLLAQLTAHRSACEE